MTQKASSGRGKKAVGWALALVAIALVVWKVPIRDRCTLPGEPPNAPRYTVVREETRCVLKSGDREERIALDACAKLVCEPGLASTMGGARRDVVIGLGLLYLAATAAWALRWRQLLSLARVALPFLTVWRLTLVGIAGSMILPGGVGGDALRVMFVLNRGAPVSVVVASVLLDRVIGLVTLASAAVVIGLSVGSGQSSGQAGQAVGATALLAAFPIGFVVAILILRSKPVSRIEWPSQGFLTRTVKPIVEYVADPGAPRAILSGLAVSLVLSAVNMFVIRALVYALGAEPTAERWIYVGATMAFIVAALPGLPGGWGTSEMAYVFFLGRAGLSAPVALAVALLYRVLHYSVGLTGAASYLAYGSGVPPKEGPPASLSAPPPA